MAEADLHAPTAWLFPGQGSQRKGMGKDLFAQFPDHLAAADAILGYSLATLCLADPERQLTQTQFAQPAIFVVNALACLARLESHLAPDFLAGHSLGEFNALHAAGCFDFETGVRLVAQRGALMGRANGGAMAAVIGSSPDLIEGRIAELNLDGLIDLANINSASQVVISGEAAAIRTFAADAAKSGFGRVVPLAVSAAFHSRFMRDAMAEFADLLAKADIREPGIPVLANVTGTFYQPGKVRETLARQIAGAVRWRDQMQALRSAGVVQADHVGPGTVCADLWREALAEPLKPRPTPAPAGRPPVTGVPAQPGLIVIKGRHGAEFCARHGVEQAYVAGAMYRGIASPELVAAMANAGFLAFLGAGGQSLAQVEADLARIRAALRPGKPFGVNLIATPGYPEWQSGMVRLLLDQGVHYAEASGYTGITADLVAYRFAGAARDGARTHCPNRLFAKVSRMEVASAFMAPAPAALLHGLIEAGRLTPAEAAAAALMPVASDLCIEADSGGHTDGGSLLALLPTALRLRDRLAGEHGLQDAPLVGAAGGVGTPEAIAACFALGAEFILCGSIHQCTREAATSDGVKDLLAVLGVSDTAYAPAGDMFVTGARVQVVKRGTLFAARANFLYDLYRTYPALSAVPEADLAVAERYLGAPCQSLWEASARDLAARRPAELARIEGNEKAKMARVFKSYFTRTMHSALAGLTDDKVNWQIHSGPALGAFNGFAGSIGLEDWRDRRIALIAAELMDRAAQNQSGS